MKYIKQFTIIMTISLLGELLAEILPWTIPASVYGLFLMLIALITKIIKVEHVKETSDFLMDVMPIMFVPASVGLMVSWGILQEILIPVLIVSVLGTLIVMIASGKTVDGIMKLTSKNVVISDGIAVDGIAVDGIAVDGIAVDGIVIDRIAVHGDATLAGNDIEENEQEGQADE